MTVVVQIPKVGAVHGSTGQDTRRNRKQHVARVGERVCSRLMNWDQLVTACSVRDDTEGSADLVGKFGSTM
jgi:hypothetical protein